MVGVGAEVKDYSSGASFNELPKVLDQELVLTFSNIYYVVTYSHSHGNSKDSVMNLKKKILISRI